jgi:hypothetical protein
LNAPWTMASPIARCSSPAARMAMG